MPLCFYLAHIGSGTCFSFLSLNSIRHSVSSTRKNSCCSLEIYKAKFKWSDSHNIEDWKKQNKNRIVFVSHCYLVVINFKPSIIINQCDNVSYSRLTCWTFLITPRLLSFTKRTMIVFLLSYLQRVRKSRWEQFLLSLSLSKYHIYFSVCGLWFPFTKQTVTIFKKPKQYCYFVRGTCGRLCQ